MPAYIFDRDSRTPYSEAYDIEQAGQTIGRVDLHFTPSTMVYATLCVPQDFDDAQIEELIGEVDERLVLTTDPYRDDFVVTVWRGASAGVYSEDDEDPDEEDEDTDEDTNGNGRTSMA